MGGNGQCTDAGGSVGDGICGGAANGGDGAGTAGEGECGRSKSTF